MFDGDADGMLNKHEFKRYLKSINGLETHTNSRDDPAFDDTWLTKCCNLGCAPDEGIGAREFEARLYGSVRHGLLDRDIDAANAAAATDATGEEQPGSDLLLIAEQKRLLAEEQNSAAAAEIERNARAIRRRSAFPTWSADPLRQLQKIESTRQRDEKHSVVLALQQAADRRRSRGSWSVPFDHAVYAQAALKAPRGGTRSTSRVKAVTATTSGRSRRRSDTTRYE